MTGEQGINPMVLFQFLLIFIIFYFFIIKPQKDKQKQHKDMVENIKKNDEIITAGGLHGTVVNVKDKTIIARFDDNVKIELDKEAVSTVKTKPKEE